MQDTDIYVFREANGRLLMEVKGIDKDEISGGPSPLANLYYTVGLMDLRATIEAQNQYGGSFWIWGDNAGGLNPQIYRSYTESLVPGETVKIIAINRASGYMGSKRVTLKGAGKLDQGLDFDIDDIVLRPPNLKVWAERKHKVELGVNTDEIKHYLIGNEGAGLSNDYYLVVYSEWLDQDGSPLPEELLDYGYTGRLAYVSDSNELDDVSFAEHFSIQPGSRMHLLRLPEDTGPSAAKHYYVQVSGQPKSRQTIFSSIFNVRFASGDQTGALKYRPNKFVPVLTPIYDEEATLLAKKAWQHLNDVPPKPIYQWVYRPEYQFSVYDLVVNELMRVTEDSGEIIDLTTDPRNEINSSDDYVGVFYDLYESEFEQLQPYSYEDRELIFSLAGYEKEVLVTEDGVVNFINPEYLEHIKPEDLIALEFYTNNDAGNILWEYAFGRSGLIVDSSEDSGSREARSFIMCHAPAIARGACESQQAITLTVSDDFSPDDQIMWTVEALEGNSNRGDIPDAGSGGPTETQLQRSYGQTKDWKIGRYAAINNINGLALGQTGFGGKRGMYGDEWNSGNLRFDEAKSFSFVPDVQNEPHVPATYTPGAQASISLSGTRRTDVWRHNPHFGYIVKVYINGEERYNAEIKMDEIDVVRQEYINHDSAVAKVPVPNREQFAEVVNTPNFLAGDLNNTVYGMVPGEPGALAEAVRAEYNSRIHDDVQAIAVGTTGLQAGAVVVYPGQDVVEIGAILDTPACNGSTSSNCDDLIIGSTIVAGPNGIAETTALNEVTNYGLTISSPWRHPERNERVSGHINSKHQLGSAIDMVVGTVPGKTRAQLFCILESAADSIEGHFGLAEHNSTQVACNDVGAATRVTHVHTQVD